MYWTYHKEETEHTQTRGKIEWYRPRGPQRIQTIDSQHNGCRPPKNYHEQPTTVEGHVHEVRHETWKKTKNDVTSRSLRVK